MFTHIETLFFFKMVNETVNEEKIDVEADAAAFGNKRVIICVYQLNFHRFRKMSHIFSLHKQIHNAGITIVKNILQLLATTTTHKKIMAMEEFQYLVKLGICRLSNSSWASPPLHLVDKENEVYRRCGDYIRALIHHDF